MQQLAKVDLAVGGQLQRRVADCACGCCHGQVARCAAACGAADACGHGAAGAKGHGGDGAGKDVRKGSVQSALLDVGFVRAPAQLGVEPDEFLVVQLGDAVWVKLGVGALHARGRPAAHDTAGAVGAGSHCVRSDAFVTIERAAQNDLAPSQRPVACPTSANVKFVVALQLQRIFAVQVGKGALRGAVALGVVAGKGGGVESPAGAATVPAAAGGNVLPAGQISGGR